MKSSEVPMRLLVLSVASLLCTCSDTGDRDSYGDIGSTRIYTQDGGGNQMVSENASSTQYPYGDEPSNGGTITFMEIGAPGWYPSRRDPASGQCDAVNNGDCCMTRHELTGNLLCPWDEELIMTLRGPIIVKEIVVYQPDEPSGSQWNLVSAWDDQNPGTPQGMAFKGNGTETGGFHGIVGNLCLVDVSTGTVYPCGPGSVPYCPTGATQYYGWAGSKLIILLSSMPHVESGVIDNGEHCSTDPSNGWYNAPWIGLSHGELVRSGKFGGCHCYAKNPAEWWLADGCGQFNVFEVVNDNNDYQNFDLFSTNLFAYHGYVGEGPCGKNCDLTGLDPKVDLINKSNSLEASTGATVTPDRGPGAAFVRPVNGYRFFVMLLDVQTRTIQLAIIHPESVPAQIGSLLPDLPEQTDRTTIDNLIALRLPGPLSTAVLED